MASTFSVGDRVRTVNNTGKPWCIMNPSVGETGHIQKIHGERACDVLWDEIASRKNKATYMTFSEIEHSPKYENRYAKGKWLVYCKTKEEWEELCDMVGAGNEWKKYWGHPSGTTGQIKNGKIECYCRADYEGWFETMRDGGYSRVPFKSSKVIYGDSIHGSMILSGSTSTYATLSSSVAGTAGSLTIDKVESLWNQLQPTAQPSVVFGYDTAIIEPKKKLMDNIIAFAKGLTLSADEKLLRKVGLKNECGDYTPTARELVFAKLCSDNEAYLLDVATKMEAEKAKK